MPLEPERFEFETSSQSKTGKDEETKQKTSFSFDTEDIIAFFGGVVAVFTVLGMLTHLLPVDKLTISIASLSTVSAAAAKIVQARRVSGTKKNKKA
jgi:hypothetical protein